MTFLPPHLSKAIAGLPSGFASLVALRYVAALAQLVTLGIVKRWFAPHLAMQPMLAVVGVIVLSNVVLALLAPHSENPRRIILFTILLDVALLTIQLALSGGAHNPFTVLYLVHVALTAMLLGPWSLLLVLGACVAGYASLFVWYLPLPACLGGHSSGTLGFSAHLHGMWVAFLVAGTATATLMYQLSAAVARERERSERHLRLLGLATLAAGAAHEIGNPLATIKVAASELRQELLTLGEPGSELAKDADLIVAEVERAWRAVRGLAAGAGELNGEPIAPIALADLLHQLRDQVEPGPVVLDTRTRTPSAKLRLPAQAVVAALNQVVRNAMQASPIGEVVELDAELVGAELSILVRDRGPGIDSRILRRLGEPFLTTKEPGRGMGLGLFVTRSLVEHLSGSLTITARAGGGTQVSILLPVRGLA